MDRTPFRLQVTEQMFEDDGQGIATFSPCEQPKMNPPEIVLTFVPRPSGIGLIGVGMLGLRLTCRKRSQVRRNEYTGGHLQEYSGNWLRFTNCNLTQGEPGMNAVRLAPFVIASVVSVIAIASKAPIR